MFATIFRRRYVNQYMRWRSRSFSSPGCSVHYFAMFPSWLELEEWDNSHMCPEHSGVQSNRSADHLVRRRISNPLPGTGPAHLSNRSASRQVKFLIRRPTCTKVNSSLKLSCGSIEIINGLLKSHTNLYKHLNVHVH